MKIETYRIKTVMGKISSSGDQLDFLDREELKEFDSIGYSGKLTDGTEMTRSIYLSKVRPSESFKIDLIYPDTGDFCEEFLITRVSN